MTDAMNFVEKKSIEELEREQEKQDEDPEDEDLDLYEEGSGYFPSLFDKQ